MRPDFPLDFLGVTGEIERVREAAGRDLAKLADLAEDLERYLTEAAPGTPELAYYARTVLGNYLCMARHGFYPEIHRPEDL